MIYFFIVSELFFFFCLCKISSSLFVILVMSMISLVIASLLLYMVSYLEIE